MWIEHHFKPVCTNSILVCPSLSPMNAILWLKESGELVAMSRDTRCRDLRVIRIAGIKKNNRREVASRRETGKLKREKNSTSENRVYISCLSKCQSCETSTLCKFAPCIGFLSRWSRKRNAPREINVEKTNVWQFQRTFSERRGASPIPHSRIDHVSND